MFKTKPTNDSLNEAIAEAIRELNGHEAHTDEYRNIVNQLTALNAIQETKKDCLSKDTLVLALANLAGIFLIINHENVNVITSKALPFVGKFK